MYADGAVWITYSGPISVDDAAGTQWIMESGV